MNKAVAFFFTVVSVVLAICAAQSGGSRFSHNFFEEGTSYKWLEKWKAVCRRNSKPFPAFVPELKSITSPQKPEKSPPKSSAKKTVKHSTVDRNQRAKLKSTSSSQVSDTISAPTFPEKTRPESEELAIGTLSVHSVPSGATVFVDGNNVGRTPIDVDVFDGSHEVRVIHPSEESERQRQVSVKAGEAARLNIEF